VGEGGATATTSNHKDNNQNNDASSSSSSSNPKGWVHVKDVLWVPVFARTNAGHKFVRRRITNGSLIWTDRDYRYGSIPEEILGGTQVCMEHVLGPGTRLELDVKRPATLYLITEKEVMGGERPRDGAILPDLRKLGWGEMADAPTVRGNKYGGKPQVGACELCVLTFNGIVCKVVFRLPVAPGITRLPTTRWNLTCCIVAVHRGPARPKDEERSKIIMDFEALPLKSCKKEDTNLKYPDLRFSDIGIIDDISESRVSYSVAIKSSSAYTFSLEEVIIFNDGIR